MTKDDKHAQSEEFIEIDLRNPALAAVLGWLWPGAGHLYQRRYPKAVLFMVVILGLFFGGLVLGSGRVVYASWTPTDKRWQYICQVGVGLPALPALVQARRVFGEPRRPPLWDGVMAPPRQPVEPERRDELAVWHDELGFRFDLGTLYTMVAGLLNVLAICDAYAGPFAASEKEEREPKS
jgi:hypothetical protein